MMERILDVRNLRISFRTNNGTVKAVRDVSFGLSKGETLAIVGESGSGKSVTARAIMGILAPNAIVDNGEIIYDGKDLLKLPESDFHLLRGDKLSMIFQDPLSSLNPIVRIGKQLTEAMLLNNKERRRNAGTNLKRMLGLLEESINQALGDTSVIRQATAKKVAVFRDFVNKGIELEGAYDAAFESADEADSDIEELLISMIQGDPQDNAREARRIIKVCARCFNPFFLAKEKSGLSALLSEIEAKLPDYARTGEGEALKNSLTRMQGILKDAMGKTRPNFFCLGYYLQHCKQAADTSDIDALNKAARTFLDDQFMLDFLRDVSSGIRGSYAKSMEKKLETVNALKESLEVFTRQELDESVCRKTAGRLAHRVNSCIDRLAIQKNNAEYIFATSLHTAIDRYFQGKKNNPRELRRVAKHTAKYNRLIAAHKDAAKVAPAVLTDLDAAKANMKKAIEDVLFSYAVQTAKEATIDFDAIAVGMIDFLKLQASHCATKLTKQGAKHRALELMSEVGISEPRKRYRQYPFQFSGGMRQRIVIAIALSADPDLLICDEPTTALDVTIQSQILELIDNLKRKRGLSIIFITHDLGVVANMADRIAVMYAGKVVEYGKADDIFYEPSHPYTWALLSSMPDLDTKEKLAAIPGTPPNMITPPEGDAFAPRNQYALQIDFEQQPPFFKVSDSHYAATWLLHPDAPKVQPPAIVTNRIARMKKLEEVSHEQ